MISPSGFLEFFKRRDRDEIKTDREVREKLVVLVDRDSFRVQKTVKPRARTKLGSDVGLPGSRELMSSEVNTHKRTVRKRLCIGIYLSSLYTVI